MAAPQCMSQDGNQAVFVGTLLETGDGFSLCDECLVAWCAAMLSTMTGIDATPFVAAISQPDDVPTVAQGAPSDEPPPVQPADADPSAQPTQDGPTPSLSADHGLGDDPAATGPPADRRRKLKVAE